LNNDRPTQKMEDSPPFPFKIPVIADYKPIRVIGTGSFGQVWIALDATGSPCALKIIHKGKFDNEVFWKEFEGVKNYLPISRGNMGLVTILHVGKDPQENFYYYTMELADNANDSIGEDWKEYEALSLSLQINRIQMLYPLDKFEEIAINLADGLAHLHENGLVHRDIKPSNVIFINGKAKLADVGLVTKGVEASTFIGTAGYIPPEGPGMPAADVYALGKTFYELLTGKGIQDFPELPTMISDGSKTKSFATYNLIVAKSCEPNYLERIQDGSELLNSLKNINKLKDNRKNEPRSRFPLLKTLIFLFFAALLIFYYDREFNDSKIIASLNEFQEMYPEQILNSEPEETIREENDSKEVRSEISISNNSNNTVAEFFLPRTPFQPMERIEGNEKEERFLPRILQVPMDSIESGPIEVNPKKVKKIESKKTVQKGEPFQWSEMKITMPWIPPGSFLMGSPESETDRRIEEKLKVKFNIEKGFWLSSHEVTQYLFQKIMKRNLSSNRTSTQLPAENLSWNDATSFCSKLTLLAHDSNMVPMEFSFNLPTEAQWEYACRAESDSRFSSGNTLGHKFANFRNNIQKSNKTIKVGTLLPNRWGFYDMHGNVAEFTLDWFSPTKKFKSSDKYSYISKNEYKIAKGGAWNNPQSSCRSASRSLLNTSEIWHNVGFRICLIHL